MSFSFKRADKSEVGLIRLIAEETWPATYRDILSAEQLDYMFKWMYNEDELTNQMADGAYFYVIYQDNIPAGFASLQVPDSMTSKLDKIYIRPQFQGSGIGTALLSFIINKARSLGSLRLLLNVNRNNKARFFYEKMGFSIVEEKDIAIGHDFFMNDYIMCYNLQSPDLT